jgi:hypothetical protein
MKLTMKKLTQIIREETAHVLKEVRYYTPGGKDDPFNQRYADDAVKASDRGANDEGWDDSPRPDWEGDYDDEEAETKPSPAKVKPEAKALRDFLRTVFEDPEYTWADFDNEHYMILKGVLKNRDDENREALKQAAEANNLNWRNLLVDVDWIVRGYGMPKSFLGLEDALKAQG